MTSPLLTRFCRALVVLLAAVLAGSLATAASAQEAGTDDARVVDILPIEGLIDPPVAAAITDAIVDANARGSELVILQIDSPGAVSVDLDELATTIRDSAVPVVVYVGPLTAQAELRGGAMVLLAAAHVRAVATDASFGPLAPLLVGDRIAAESTAAAIEQVHALWPELESEGLSGLALTDLATSSGEELAAAFDITAAGLQPLLVDLDGATVTTGSGDVTLRVRSDELDVRFLTMGLVRRMLHAATTPAFIYLLLTIGLAMLLFEVFQPGFGVAGIAGLITAGIGVFGLTVLPVAWWAVSLVVLGLILYAVDTAVAGFGPVTLAATAAFGVGSYAFYDSPVIGLPLWLVILTTIAALVFFVVVLTVVLRAQAGPEDAAVEDLVGKLGIVRSVLNPEGHVFIDEALWRARWTGETKRAKVGTPIRVHAVDGPVVLVEAFDPQAVQAERAGADSSDA